MTSTDRIEKRVHLRAPRSRVWRAIADSAEFGEWFRVRLEGPFVAGKSTFGQILQPGYEHLRMELQVEAIEPERRLAYRWHPHGVDPQVDYSVEPSTLVEFMLDDADGGTALTIIESGFDQIPAARRAEAFRMNDQGWGIQAANVARHVEGR